MAMNGSATIARSFNTLQELMKMGISKQRSEKAIAASGDVGVEDACAWLVNHINDQDLEKVKHREYVIYLVPTGPLLQELNSFMKSSMEQCGRNGAHKTFPHTTLCKFFSCKDSLMAECVHTMQQVFDKYLPSAPKSFNLQPYKADKYFGLLLSDNTADWFKNMLYEFAHEVSKLDIEVESHKKQLHLTLAFKFLQEHRQQLDQLSKKINYQAPANWEMRLYSRDPRLSNSEIYRVLFEYTPQKKEDLELLKEDYIFMTELDLRKDTSKGWFYGTCWQKGISGLFPGNYVEVAPESDCWVLHRTCYLYNHCEVVPQFRKTIKKKQAHEYEEAETAYKSDDLLAKTDLYTKVKKTEKVSKITPESLPSPVPKPQGPNRIFIFRHAERIDATFGQNWIRCSFDKEGNYDRKNLNMPISLPKREGGPERYNKDSPITLIGQFQSRITGEGMRDEGVRITQAFSSPSLRCVETAQHILAGLGAEGSVGIKVEPGLFEWMAWARGKLPDWMKLDEMAISGLNVDLKYKYIKHPEGLPLEERADDYYRRSYHVIKKIAQSVPSNSAIDILVLAHAGSLDALSRMLVGQLPRSAQELTRYTQQVPYVGCCMLEEAEGSWKLTPPPFSTLVHGPNKKFDWRDMML